MDIPTCDPGVVIVAQGPAMVRYRNAASEWTVHGLCDQRGRCVVGTVVHGHQIRDVADYRQMRELLGDRLGFRLDCPVTPALKGCCEFRFEGA